MKKQGTVLIAIAAFAVGLGLNNVAMSDVNQRIAVVDVNQVVAKSAQVQALKKEQTQKMTELQNWLTGVRSDIQKQQTNEGKQALAKKYDAEFAKKKEAIAKNYQAKLTTIDKNISATIQTQAKAQGYSIVLSKAAVLYGGEDITASIAKVVK